MKLARYWARESGETIGPGGSRLRAVARGWSNDSLEAARAAARTAASRLAERLAAGRTDGARYPYGERPLPEPLIQELRDGAGEAAAVVTRNAYGALVLNSRELMFADIDRDDAAPAGPAGGLVTGLRSLFGKPAPAAPAAESPVLADVRRVAEARGLGVRLYRTAAGYRAIVTSARQPAGAASEDLLRQFGADPLYVKLCRMQESFRARLTPKPWRCGVRTPPVAYPFSGPADESRFRAWEAEYAAAGARYATCRYVASLGDARIAPGLEALVRYHDQQTKADTTLPLA